MKDTIHDCQEDQITNVGDGEYKSLLVVLYAILVAGLLLCWVPTLNILLFVATIGVLVYGYVKRVKAKGSWMESHYRWCLRTVIWSLVWAGLLGLAFMGTTLGMIGMVASGGDTGSIGTGGAILVVLLQGAMFG